MYFSPRNYRCLVCGFEMDYSPSHNYSFLPIADNGAPFCFKCLKEFIAKNVSVMEIKP